VLRLRIHISLQAYRSFHARLGMPEVVLNGIILEPRRKPMEGFRSRSTTHFCHAVHSLPTPSTRPGWGNRTAVPRTSQLRRVRSFIRVGYPPGLRPTACSRIWLKTLFHVGSTSRERPRRCHLRQARAA
jgi:hypothetical protein